ncbi:unnamed protein product [Caenorhabditis sp. 36 PRJEB53466]|nr:unnamed protein product [Caenorhabditis sp. 36 PRJEB53466]
MNYNCFGFVATCLPADVGQPRTFSFLELLLNKDTSKVQTIEKLALRAVVKQALIEKQEQLVNLLKTAARIETFAPLMLCDTPEIQRFFVEKLVARHQTISCFFKPNSVRLINTRGTCFMEFRVKRVKDGIPIDETLRMLVLILQRGCSLQADVDGVVPYLNELRTRIEGLPKTDDSIHCLKVPTGTRNLLWSITRNTALL